MEGIDAVRRGGDDQRKVLGCRAAPKDAALAVRRPRSVASPDSRILIPSKIAAVSGRSFADRPYAAAAARIARASRSEDRSSSVRRRGSSR
jgi:hypothetical protein